MKDVILHNPSHRNETLFLFFFFFNATKEAVFDVWLKTSYFQILLSTVAYDFSPSGLNSLCWLCLRLNVVMRNAADEGETATECNLEETHCFDPRIPPPFPQLSDLKTKTPGGASKPQGAP